MLWDIASGGAGSETTLRRNRLSMEEFTFNTRVMSGVNSPDLGATVFGRKLSSPILLAPIGSLSLFTADGAVTSAHAAAEAGTMAIVGVLATPGLRNVAAAVGGDKALQLYVRGGRTWLGDVVRAAEDAGYAGLCLTVDSLGESARERELHNGIPPNLPRSPDLPPGQDRGLRHQTSFTWRDFDWLRSTTRLPIAIKGILSAEDATMAVEHGADAVYISNHGGREIDHLPAALTCLPAIAAAVGGRAAIFIDGGFIRGSDVVKALALGADAVLIGRLQVWAVAAGGVEALLRVLQLMQEEVRQILCVLGVPRVADLTPACVRPAVPVGYRPSYLTEYQAQLLPGL